MLGRSDLEFCSQGLYTVQVSGVSQVAVEVVVGGEDPLHPPSESNAMLCITTNLSK